MDGGAQGHTQGHTTNILTPGKQFLALMVLRRQLIAEINVCRHGLWRAPAGHEAQAVYQRI